MEYNKIIAVTGLPGLYELISSKTDGAIVRSLDDKSTRFVSSRVHNFSHLESIEIYTVRENVNLVDILKAMETSSEKLPDEKNAEALKAYFTKVYPDMDFERVYSSDLKKMVKWFVVLQANKIEIKLTEAAPEETAGAEAPEEAKEKPAAKKKAEKVEKEEAPEEATPKAKKPAATAKKKTEDAAAPEQKKVTKEKKEAPAAEKPKKPAAKKKS